MINIENISANIVRIIVPEKLKTNDFVQFSSQINGFIQKYGKIRLLVDASSFDGWDNMDAFEKHIGFVKSHHQKVERIAVIAGHTWQHWVIGTFRMFIHPEVKIFDKNESNEAMTWIAA